MYFKKWGFILIFIFLFSFVSGDIISINSGGDNQLIINPDNYIESFFSSHNLIPNDPSPVLISVDGSNTTNSNLQCSSLIIDRDTSSLNFSVRWYKGNLLQFTMEYYGQTNGTVGTSTINNGLLTEGDVWKCSMRVYDGFSYSDWITSNDLTIFEYVPICGDGICELNENSINCPADCFTDPGTGGGGGGGGGDTSTSEDSEIIAPIGADFDVNPKLMIVEMKKGTYYSKIITVTNNGSLDLNIGMVITSLDNFVFPQIKSLFLEPGESQQVIFDIYVSKRTFSDVYVGKILFLSPGLQRSTDMVLDIDEKDALFDIRTDVLKKYINPGGRIRANVSIINFGSLRNFDVELEYKILGFDEEVYTIKKEDFAINHTYNNIFFLDVPRKLNVGNYVFYTQVRYPNGNVSASSFDTFTVERISLIAWIILIIIIIILMYLAYRWYKKKDYSIFEDFKKKLLKEKAERAPLENVKKKVIHTGGVPKLPEVLEE
ncbi:MAG: hypothetical protein U9R00_03065 [Patescibacteria group bacterium]|nr:hypothetical protein [Patescibacteria group bacterium]